MSTRPKSARGGYGISLQVVHRRTRVIERLYQVLSESSASYGLWRQLLVQHGVQGVQVYDARLVALIQSHGIIHLLTLNAADFTRYAGIIAWTPQDVVAMQSSP